MIRASSAATPVSPQHPARWTLLRAALTAILVGVVAVLGGCSAATSSGTARASDPGRSPGCDSSATPTRGTFEDTITVGGVQRRQLVHVPSNYSPTDATPLVVTMHGSGSTAAEQLALTGMATTSEQYGFIVLAPQAIGGQWALPPASDPSRPSADIAYVNEAVKQLANRFCIDTSRQYASGMSQGSAMTLVLACEKDRRFAAFGGVGANFYQPICDRAGPAPLIYFHGTADRVVPISGGNVRGYQVTPTLETMTKWAAHNKCTTGPRRTEIGDTTEFAWGDCAGNADVDYYQVSGGGHTWPGAPSYVAQAIEPALGKTTTAVAASDLMWKFFSNYRLPD